jgi:hypothetical protein
VLLLIVEPVMAMPVPVDRIPAYMPPVSALVLPVTTVFFTEIDFKPNKSIPPAWVLALLSVTNELLMLTVSGGPELPYTVTPAPNSAEHCEMTTLLRVRDSVEKTPPLSPPAIAPRMIDRPEIVAGLSVVLLPSLMSNTRLLPAASMMSLPAPGPVIVTFPLLVNSVPPSTIVFSLCGAGAGSLKTTLSGPGDASAAASAARKLPVPESASVVTVNVAGATRDSSAWIFGVIFMGADQSG